MYRLGLLGQVADAQLFYVPEDAAVDRLPLKRPVDAIGCAVGLRLVDEGLERACVASTIAQRCGAGQWFCEHGVKFACGQRSAYIAMPAPSRVRDPRCPA